MSSPNHPSLKDAAAGYIRDQIVSGAFLPGSKIDQDEVAEELGISRLPVREALIELGEKGYVVAVPRRGVFVVELSEDDIEDHFEVLGAVFAIAARRAAAGIDQEQLRRLHDIHESLDAVNDPSERERLNREFMQIVNRSRSSPRLRSILQSLSGALPGAYYLASPDWDDTEAKFRGRMLEALETHEPDVAAALATEHLQECGRLAIGALRRRSSDG